MLGVTTPSLYKHVPSLGAIQTAIAERGLRGTPKRIAYGRQRSRRRQSLGTRR